MTSAPVLLLARTPTVDRQSSGVRGRLTILYILSVSSASGKSISISTSSRLPKLAGKGQPLGGYVKGKNYKRNCLRRFDDSACTSNSRRGGKLTLGLWPF